MQARILVVEDDAKLKSFLEATLRKESFGVTVAVSAAEAYGLLDREQFDLMVLDPLAGGGRRTALKRLLQRAHKFSLPVVALLSREEARSILDSLGDEWKERIAASAEPARVLGRVKQQLQKLDRFHLAELDAAKRRQRPLVFGGVTVDIRTRAVLRNGQETYLRPKEFKLLCFLLERPGVVCSRQEIMRHVWGPNHPSAPKAVDVTMRSLRQKVEDEPSHPQFLVTERGKGYMFAG